MSEKRTYNITFKGYKLEENASSMPKYSGIYIAYICKYKVETNKVLLKEIVYIGQAENLNKRITEHKKLGDLQKECIYDETICYAYASVSLNDLDVVENALVFAQKPRLNKQLKNDFKHKRASFIIEGSCSLLNYTNFTIS